MNASNHTTPVSIDLPVLNSHKNESLFSNLTDRPIPTPKGYPYRGTYRKPRFRDHNTDVIVYPKEHSTLDHWIESTIVEKLKTVRGNQDLFKKRKRFFRQYRNGRRISIFNMPSNQTVYLIIVNNHFAGLKHIDFMDNVYFPTFASLFPFSFDVVYISAALSEEKRVFENPYTFRGHYSYHSFRMIYDLFPREEGFVYSGYLLMNDDSYVDPLFLKEYNLSRSWGEERELFNKIFFSNWNSITNTMGVTFSQALMEAIDDLAGIPDINAKCQFTTSNQIRKGWGDFFYVSESDLVWFLRMEEVMFSHRVFLEHAVPTILHCLNQLSIVDCNHRHMVQRTHCLHIHPVKLSTIDSQTFVKKRLRHLNMYEVPVSSYSLVC